MNWLPPVGSMNSETFKDASFIPNHYKSAGYQLTCLPVECSGFFPVFRFSCTNLFETCCRHQTQKKHILTKIYWVDRKKHEIYCLCCCQFTGYVKKDEHIITVWFIYILCCVPTFLESVLYYINIKYPPDILNITVSYSKKNTKSIFLCFFLDIRGQMQCTLHKIFWIKSQVNLPTR